MSKVVSLPDSETVTLPVTRGASVRLRPFRNSPHVLVELRGPRGGDLGAVVLHRDAARVLADGLGGFADGCGPAEAALRVSRLESLAEEGRPSRAGFLNVITASLDPDATLISFAYLTVPVFADWCTVDVLEGGQLPHRLTVIHADTSKREAAEVLARYPHDPGLLHPRSSVWSSGEPDLAAEVSDARVVAAARSPEHLAVLRALRCRSSMAVPLVADGRVRGVMTFALAESRRHYSEDDLPLALMLARSAAIAAENARLYRQVQGAIHRRIGSSPTRAGGSRP